MSGLPRSDSGAHDLVFGEGDTRGAFYGKAHHDPAGRGFEMKARMSIAGLAALMMLLGGASASEAASSAVAKACAKDVKALCGSVKSGGGARKACVNEHFSKLSVDCQIAIVKAAAVGRACKADAKKFCSDVKPGANGVAKCLDTHVADVSDACRDAMEKAEGGAR
jgi:hypothetical protein